MLLHKTIYRLLYLLLFIVAIMLASWRLPAYAGRMPWLLIVALTDLYLLWHLSRPGFWPSQVLRNISGMLILLPSILLLLFLISMAFFSPVEWNPVLRTYLLGMVVLFYAIRFFPLLVLLIHDTVRLIRRKSLNEFPGQGFLAWSGISVGLSGIVAIVMILGMTLWVYDFEILEKEIPVRDLPAAFDAYRIVHISDLHLGRWHSGETLQRAVDMVNDLQPDMIAFTGDLVNYSTTEAYPFKTILAGLRATDGVFAVLGNHDYGDYMRWQGRDEKQLNIDAMYTFLDEMDWVLLENRHVNIYSSDQCLTLIGTGHHSTKKYIPDRADFREAVSGADISCTQVLLTHTPEMVNAEMISEHPVNLILSGHTHALQLGIRVGGKEFSPAAFVYRFWGGLYQLDTMGDGSTYLYVNRGLGHIAFPVRIGMKPEITLLTLRAE
jgi:uncharacterized protein